MPDAREVWGQYWPVLARQALQRPEYAHLLNDPAALAYMERLSEMTAMMVFRTFITHPDFAMHWADFCWKATDTDGENPFINQVESMVGMLGMTEDEPPVAEEGAWAYEGARGDLAATIVCGVCVKFMHRFETDPGKDEAVKIAAGMHDQSSCVAPPLPGETEPELEGNST